MTFLHRILCFTINTEAFVLNFYIWPQKRAPGQELLLNATFRDPGFKLKLYIIVGDPGLERILSFSEILD